MKNMKYINFENYFWNILCCAAFYLTKKKEIKMQHCGQGYYYI